MHSAVTEIRGTDDKALYVAVCASCGWHGTETESHKQAAQEAFDHTDPEAIEEYLAHARLTYPDITVEEAFALHD